MNSQQYEIVESRITTEYTYYLFISDAGEYIEIYWRSE